LRDGADSNSLSCSGKRLPDFIALTIRSRKRQSSNAAHSFGKHEGHLPGAPRTGNDLKMTSITIHRIAGGKLVEKWAEKDVLGFLQQIGVMPSPKHVGTEHKSHHAITPGWSAIRKSRSEYPEITSGLALIRCGQALPRNW